MSAPQVPPLADVISEAIDTLTCFSIPLYIDKRGRPLHIGTGFFVTSGSDCFLVSAAHVLDIAVASGMYFYSTPQEKRHLDGRLIRSKAPEGRHKDIIDIGVLKLGPVGRPPFPDVRKFAMDISYLKPIYTPRSDKGYAIIGFPCTKNGFRVHKKDVLAAPYAYRSQSIPESIYVKHGVSTESHVLLPLDLKKAFGPAGEAMHFPKPDGMSGAPVVVLYGDQGEESRVFPVVAVGIEYRTSDRVLVATDVRFVLEAIQHAA